MHLQGERAVQVAYLSMCGLQESGAHQAEVLLASQPRLLVGAAPPATAKDCLAEDVEDSEKGAKVDPVTLLHEASCQEEAEDQHRALPQAAVHD